MFSVINNSRSLRVVTEHRKTINFEHFSLNSDVCKFHEKPFLVEFSMSTGREFSIALWKFRNFEMSSKLWSRLRAMLGWWWARIGREWPQSRHGYSRKVACWYPFSAISHFRILCNCWKWNNRQSSRCIWNQTFWQMSSKQFDLVAQQLSTITWNIFKLSFAFASRNLELRNWGCLETFPKYLFLCLFSARSERQGM